MKAVGYYRNLPISHPEALLDLELPSPVPGDHDLLVEVQAVSVNPVDVKIRANKAPEPGQAKVIGWDAAGVVRAVGAQTRYFQPGDKVWYAGALLRSGSNSELQVVDERLVGAMPRSLDFTAAAALPLTAITAWELLFDRLRLDQTATRGASLLVMGAAGGVGSILIQLARQLTDLTVIATASRPQTRQWVTGLGAHHVLDHHQPLAEQLQQLGFDSVDYIAGLNQTDQHFDAMVEVIRPQGQIALIDDPELIDVRKLKLKSVSLHWEFMFTRSMFGTADMVRQHQLLNRVAELIDEGVLRSTLSDCLGPIDAANLRKAHRLIESQAACGKIVLAGF